MKPEALIFGKSAGSAVLIVLRAALWQNARVLQERSP